MKKTTSVKTKYLRSNFEIDNGNSVYRLMENLSPEMSQDELAEFYEIEKKKGNPVPIDSIKVYEIMEDAVKSNNTDLLNHLYKTFRRDWVLTSTRIVCDPRGEDEVIHNYGNSDSYSIKGNIVGKNSWIKDLEDTNALELLLKNKDVQRINEISNQISKVPMYLWRLDSKPYRRFEFAVRFVAGDRRLGVFADWDPFGKGPAFLVLSGKN